MSFMHPIYDMTVINAMSVSIKQYITPDQDVDSKVDAGIFIGEMVVYPGEMDPETLLVCCFDVQKLNILASYHIMTTRTISLGNP